MKLKLLSVFFLMTWFGCTASKQVKQPTSATARLMMYVSAYNPARVEPMPDLKLIAKYAKQAGVKLKAKFPRLTLLATHKRKDVRRKAIVTFVFSDLRLRKEAVSRLISLLKGKHPDAAQFLPMRLRFTQESKRFLIPALKHSNPQVRATVLSMFGRAYLHRFRSQGVDYNMETILARGLRDSSSKVQKAALYSALNRSGFAVRNWKTVLSIYFSTNHSDKTRLLMKDFLSKNLYLKKKVPSLQTTLEKQNKKKWKEVIGWLEGRGELAAMLKKAYLSKKSLVQGKAIFAKHCKACHLSAGTGLIGPNLTDLHSVHGVTLKALYQVVTFGGRSGKGMVPWKQVLPMTDRVAVVAYVASLKKKALPGKAPTKAEKKRSLPDYLKPDFN